MIRFICYTTLLLVFTVSTAVLTASAELYQYTEIKVVGMLRRAVRRLKMGYKAEFLSQAEVCAIYQCLDGHIHLKYRTLDIAMDACDFHQVAEVFVEALRVLQDVEEPVTEDIDLKNMDTLVKV